MYFSLQIHEPAYISTCAQFIAFLKYDTTKSIIEDILYVLRIYIKPCDTERNDTPWYNEDIFSVEFLFVLLYFV